MTKTPSQEQVWDKIAENWKDNRTLPIIEAEEFLKDKKGKILDLGCGSGRNVVKSLDSEKSDDSLTLSHKRCAQNKEFYGVDFSQEMVNIAEKEAKGKKVKAKFFKANAWELPFEDNFFDSAIFIAALHCIPSKENREDSLKELRRVLKSGSRALITVWDRNQERFTNPKTANTSAPAKFISGNEAYLPWGTGDFPDRQEFLRYYYLYDKEEIVSLLEKYFKVIKIYSTKESESRFSRRNLIIEIEKI